MMRRLLLLPVRALVVVLAILTGIIGLVCCASLLLLVFPLALAESLLKEGRDSES